jgi:hypothetical protein
MKSSTKSKESLEINSEIVAMRNLSSRYHQVFAVLSAANYEAIQRN